MVSRRQCSFSRAVAAAADAAGAAFKSSAAIKAEIFAKEFGLDFPTCRSIRAGQMTGEMQDNHPSQNVFFLKNEYQM